MEFINKYQFNISAVDTDSIVIYKTDSSSFSEEEQEAYIDEINKILPKYINFSNDGYFEKMIILKSKNYILYDGKKIELKGSSLKDTKKEPALKEMQFRMIQALIQDEAQLLTDIYNEYIKESFNVKDISRWATKKTISKAVLGGGRKNETKILDAIDTESVQEGDKVWLFPVIDGEEQVMVKGEPSFYKDGTAKMKPKQILKQVDDFDGNIDSDHLLKRIYSTVKILENVIDMDLFIDYTKKNNKDKLKELL